MVNRLPSTRIVLPFLNWLVEIMPGNSPSKRLVRRTVATTKPAQTPRYYRTDRRPAIRCPYRPKTYRTAATYPEAPMPAFFFFNDTETTETRLHPSSLAWTLER